jgi:hypothetical protein
MKSTHVGVFLAVSVFLALAPSVSAQAVVIHDGGKTPVTGII